MMSLETTRPAPQRWAYPVLLAILVVGLGTSGAPAPLYGIYAAEWGFAPLTTTIVFAVYAAAALVAVLVTGSISDRYGRRPVLLTAVGLILVGLVVFMTAQDVEMLIIARGLHGFGVGATVVAATAALLDLRPDEGEKTGRRTGVAFNVGIAVAILGTAFIADLGPDPLVTPYAILAALSAVLFLALLAMRETHSDHRAATLHVARPHVPASIRHHFRFSALGVMASWSVLGVFLSLYPSIASRAVHADHVLFGGTVVALSAGSAAIIQVFASRWPAKPAAIVGDIGTAVTLLLAIPAVDSGNGWLIAIDSAVMGLFFGLAFGSSLRHLTQHIPAEHRGEVMSAFYVLAYGAMAVPTLVAGWAATVWAPDDIFAPFISVVAVACLSAGLLGLRTPDADPVESEPAPVAA
ncbi:MFS transporter [Aeromicrobium sp. Root495]|nr:MFS transporter [Aeromicrobium sp. Root495]